MTHIAANYKETALNSSGNPTQFLKDFLGDVIGFRQNNYRVTNDLWDIDKLNIKNLPQIELRNDVYGYDENGMYVCFANRRIGGGIAGSHGFVQEEIAVFESNQFPLQIYWRKYRDPQRAQIELGKLDEIPAILKVKHLFNVRKPSKYYITNSGPYRGKINWNRYRTDLENEVAITPDKFIEVIPPREIFWLNMAAVKINGMSKANPLNPREVLIKMLRVAYRAFKDAIGVLLAYGLPCVIHTGNWGAGAFGHDVRVAFTIQRMAAWWVKTEFPNVDIKLIYYTYDSDTFAQLKPLALSHPMRRQDLLNITKSRMSI